MARITSGLAALFLAGVIVGCWGPPQTAIDDPVAVAAASLEGDFGSSEGAVPNPSSPAASGPGSSKVDGGATPVGACCFVNTCRSFTADRCETLGGDFQGPDTLCDACPALPEDVIASLLEDCDQDGRTDLEAILLGTEPCDPHDGPDIDGDGIPNEEDLDVDGDGILNAYDPDIDGGGIPNKVDSDRDGDGRPNSSDDDDDGDGIIDELDDDATVTAATRRSTAWTPAVGRTKCRRPR